ncbi:MAG: hypothetical protein ABI306_04205 [Caulobacteraceae bacterium]
MRSAPDIGSSETSRRQLIFGMALTAGAAGALAAGLAPRAAAAVPSKLPQADIGYQNKPNGKLRCDMCVNWQSPASCKVVAGSISPAGWCGLFVRKA